MTDLLGIDLNMTALCSKQPLATGRAIHRAAVNRFRQLAERASITPR
jgi:hypothetical protein